MSGWCEGERDGISFLKPCLISNLDKIKKEAVWNDETERWRVPDLVTQKTKLPPPGMYNVHSSQQTWWLHYISSYTSLLAKSWFFLWPISITDLFFRFLGQSAWSRVYMSFQPLFLWIPIFLWYSNPLFPREPFFDQHENPTSEFSSSCASCIVCQYWYFVLKRKQCVMNNLLCFTAIPPPPSYWRTPPPLSLTSTAPVLIPPPSSPPSFFLASSRPSSYFSILISLVISFVFCRCLMTLFHSSGEGCCGTVNRNINGIPLQYSSGTIIQCVNK